MLILTTSDLLYSCTGCFLNPQSDCSDFLLRFFMPLHYRYRCLILRKKNCYQLLVLLLIHRLLHSLPPIFLFSYPDSFFKIYTYIIYIYKSKIKKFLTKSFCDANMMYSLQNNAIQTGFLYHSGRIAELEQDQVTKQRKEMDKN